MRYAWLDVFIEMAKADAGVPGDFRLHYTTNRIRHTEFGPVSESKAFYTTPEGEVLIDAINRRA